MSMDNCLIEQMLQKLSLSRSSMERQIHSVSDVLDKSNNALLQIEASRSKKPVNSDTDAVPLTFNKESVNALSKIIEKCLHMLTSKNNSAHNTDNAAGINIEEYMEMAGQRSDYLACTIRKVLALWDTVQQMRIMLQREEMEADDED